ncbi:hypothetical protein DL98DRAFT_187001 [Cadophora sp. DSE1049]|nr:hypothetical protein DL98DRAFT_187001 [Cadophora sp. DSE1049]
MTTLSYDSRQDEASRIKTSDDLAGCMGPIVEGLLWGWHGTVHQKYPASFMLGSLQGPPAVSTRALTHPGGQHSKTSQPRLKTCQLIRYDVLETKVPQTWSKRPRPADISSLSVAEKTLEQCSYFGSVYPNSSTRSSNCQYASKPCSFEVRRRIKPVLGQTS